MFVAFDVGETLIRYDGVALDWSEHYRPALFYALSEIDVQPEENALADAVEILTFYNTRKNPRTFEIAAGEVTTKLASLFSARHAEFECRFFQYFQRHSSAMPGGFESLQELKRAGCYLAALSDVPYGMPTAMLTEDLGDLASAFDCIAGSCDVGIRKPNGNGLRKLLNAAGYGADRAFYVGNERKDIEAAAAAGVNSILLSSGGSPPDYGQTYTVRSLTEVSGIVL